MKNLIKLSNCGTVVTLEQLIILSIPVICRSVMAEELKSSFSLTKASIQSY